MDKNSQHPQILGYVNTVLSGWNVLILVGFFMMIGLSQLTNMLFGETPIGGIHFWIAGFVSLVVAGFAAYQGSKRLHRYFCTLGVVGNCVWLSVLAYLTVVTFPSQFAFA